MRKIDEIIIHCSDTKEGKNYYAKDIDQWHKSRGWRGIGYHYVIDLDGTLEIGRPESEKGAHCSGHNEHSIGICYIGGRKRNNELADTRTAMQRNTMYRLIDDIKSRYNIVRVVGHNYYDKNKACPCFKVPEEL
jgi:N-acetylmuramoyl-L-alanine amidase